MYLSIKEIQHRFQRTSKNGITHEYFRICKVALLKCDSCSKLFERPIGRINRKRLSNQFYHVCSNCDMKRFAQKKGSERRAVWNMRADSEQEISKL